MIIYQYDGTFDGMLTAVFDAFDRKVFPDVLMKEGGTLPLFHEELYAVQTSEEKADKRKTSKSPHRHHHHHREG